MRLIISGGGTGGHIYPAIAIANALKQHEPNSEILFVGAQGKMEMQQVPAAGYPIVGLPIRGIQRKRLLQNMGVPFQLVASLWKARYIIKDFQPDVVIGTGGYASAPVLYMATQQGIPTLIQEQNAHAGLTNRLLARWVDKVCVAYEAMEQYFPAEKIILTGNPVRQDIANLVSKRQAAHDYFGLDTDKKCLLVLGGSQGAKTINESILQAIPQLVKAGIQVLWSTGSFYFEAMQVQLSNQPCQGIKLLAFIDRMDLALAAADVVVSRAGALSIAELCLAQKPTIFVPSPNVVADHQTKNVLSLVAKQAAILVRDQEARQNLGQAITQLLGDETLQRTLVHNMQHWARPHATADIVAIIHSLAGHKNQTTS